MIPNLYENNGEVLIGPLKDSIKGIATEERNGLFEIDLIYPVFSPYSDRLLRGNIVIVDANDKLKNQKFRIYKISKPINGKIAIYARHISYDLLRDFIEGIDIKNQSCEYALNSIFRASQFCKHYVGKSDIINAQDFKIGATKALRAIAGERGSILDTFGTGAELLRDNTTISVLNKRGHDNGVTIEYKKNLTGFDYTLDETGLITRIKPFAKYRNGNEEITVYSNPTYIDSKRINDYETPFIEEKDFSSEFDEENQPTPEKLKVLAEKYFLDTKCDIPKMNYKISFIPLSKCVGYEGIEDAISLCDIVTIKNSMYNITTAQKVIKAKYDFLNDRYESMELGQAKTSLGSLIGGSGEVGPQGPPGPQGPAGADGNIESFPNTLPPIPQLNATVFGFASIELKWTYENKPYYHYELYASKTENFEPTIFNLIFSGQASTFLHQVKPSEVWYYKARALNTHSEATAYSIEVKAETRKVDNMENYFDSVAIGNAVVGAFTTDFMTAGIIKGNWIDAKQLSVTDSNGKRTLDIDSYGNVNLDVNSLKIRSENVATEGDTINKINKAISDYKKVVDSTFNEVDEAHNNLVETMEGSFKDGIINETEAYTIKQNLISIETEITEINKTYSTIYSSNELLNEFKVILEQKHIDYIAKYKELKTVIESSIADNLVTLEENTLINEKMSAYNKAYADIKNQFNISLDAIGKNRVDNLGNTVNDKFTEITKEAGLIKETIKGVERNIETINGELNNTVTKESFTEFRQNTENFELEIEKSYGSPNLMPNGAFKNGVDGYSTWNSSLVPVTNGCRVASTKIGEDIAFGITTPRFNLKANTTYTISFLVGSYYNISKLNYNFLMETQSGNIFLNTVVTWDATTTKQFRVSFSFNTNQEYKNVYLLIGYSGQVKDLYTGFTINELMLCEGPIPKIYQDRAGEIYNNLLTIDENGIKCEFENGTYSQMGRDGFEWYNAGTGHSYHALAYVTSFGIPAGNPGKVSIRLPIEFTKRFSSLRWTVALRGYYYSTSYNFFVSHLHCTGAGSYIHPDGHVYCDVQGVCKIQNADNYTDQQYRDLTAMLIAIC